MARSVLVANDISNTDDATTQGVASKHLVFMDHYATPPDMPGILRQHVFAREIKNAGWETTIVSSGFGHTTHRIIKPVSLRRPVLDEHLEGVHYRWVYTTPYTSNSIWRYVNNLSYFVTSQIRGFGQKPDVVVGVNPHLLGALAGWCFSRRYRVPFVFEVHDLWPESLVQLGLRNKPIIKVLETIANFLYRRADAIITVTDGISDAVCTKVDPNTPIVLLPSGSTVRSPMDPSERSRQRMEHGWDDHCVVMWTGSHGAANSLTTLIECAGIIEARAPGSRIRFVLVGDGPEKPHLIEQARGLSNVEFLDPVPASEVPGLLQLADAGVIVHSDTEAVRGARPTKMTEYMAVGLPIISNIQGEAAKLIEQANCGITVPTMRADLLAEAVVQVSAGRDAYVARGQNGVEFVRATHDRSTLAGKLVDLLSSLTSR